MKNYQCRHCGLVLQSESRPSSGTCPAQKSRFEGHYWDDLGRVGNKNYQCRNCGQVLKSEERPSSGTCPAEKNSLSGHYWDKL